MRRLALGLLAFGVLLPAAAQPASSPSPDPAALLGQAPWVGMTAWDAAWCRDLVFRAGYVELREPDQPMRVIWVKDARGWLKPNGFYGLKINGEVVDEALVWLRYAGDLVNLRVLFTYGSAPVDGVFDFRDAGLR
jgi:hypothetical protein